MNRPESLKHPIVSSFQEYCESLSIETPTFNSFEDWVSKEIEENPDKAEEILTQLKEFSEWKKIQIEEMAMPETEKVTESH